MASYGGRGRCAARASGWKASTFAPPYKYRWPFGMAGVHHTAEKAGASSELDLAELKRLLKRVEKTIHDEPDDVRYAMNGFVIALGCYVASLTDLAIKAGEKIDRVTVDMGNTACKVPFAPDYIRKVQQRGTIGKKRKSAKC